MTAPLIIENEFITLSFDPESGSLSGIASRKTGWAPLGCPDKGFLFKMMVPLPKRRNNNIYSEKQRPSSIALSPDKKSIVLCWDTLASEYGGQMNIQVTATVCLNEDGADFTMKIRNNSPYPVESVDFPIIGNIRPPEESPWLKKFFYEYHAGFEWELWPTYRNTIGYYGFDTPIQSSGGSPAEPFVLYRSPDQGLYMGEHDQSYDVVAWQSELLPGWRSMIDASVPTAEEIGGKAVSTRVKAVHMPYIQPGEERELPKVTIAFFEGGWQKGVDIYKKWRNTWMSLPKTPDWASDIHSWQQIHINSPEDELRLRFTELVEVGKECAERGVKAIQLVGWNDGGQDQGNPSHDVDPRLGTVEELRQAIKEIQAMGVKVVLFVKFTWADRATEWFRNELIDYAIRDPYGDYYVYGGYRYQTAAQKLDINTKRLIPMCFLSEKYLEICEKEFQKVVALGPDGMLFDECQHHSPALVCFDQSHGHRYGAPVYANDIELLNRFKKLAPEGFLMAGEALYDRLTGTYHLAYFRSENKDHIPLSRYMQPHALCMTAVTGFNDRDMINQCLMCRYIISYEPYNFKGRLTDFPLTVAYGQKMDALRTEYRAYFWDGAYQDQCGARVKDLDTDLPHPSYSVFKHASEQTIGVVVCNYEEQPVRLLVTPDEGTDLTRYRLVGTDTWKSCVDGIELPPHSAAIVL